MSDFSIPEAKPDEERNLECRICHEPFPSEQRMRGHCWREHGVDPEPKGWEYERAQELKDAGWLCRRCGRPSALVGRLHVHHRIPRRLFENEEDSHFYANLKALCPSCHGTAENVNDSCPNVDCGFTVASCGVLNKTADDTWENDDPKDDRIYRALAFECPECEKSYDFREWLNDGLNTSEVR